MGCDEYLLRAVGLQNGHQLVALVERERTDAIGADVLEQRLRSALDRAVTGDEHEVAVLLDASAGDHCADLFARLDGEDVHDIRAPRRSAGFGDAVALADIDLALVGEEQDVVVGRSGEHGIDIVLVTGRHCTHALAASALRTVFACGQALDIAVVGEGVDALLLLDKVLDIYLVLDILYLGAAVVAVLVTDGDKLGFEHCLYLLGVCKQGFIIRYLLLKLLVLGL